jgi:hypothetical protein
MSSDRKRAVRRRSGSGSLLLLSGRTPRGRLLVIAAVTFVLLFGVAAYGRLISHDLSPRRSSPTGQTRSSGDVRIGGHAAGLYPGLVEDFRVHVDNLGRRPRIVRSVQAVVGKARTRCLARNVSVSSYRGGLRLPPRGRRWISLTIAMRPDAASACQGAVFPLTFRAKVRP